MSIVKNWHFTLERENQINILFIQSGYIDVVWKVVELEKKEGYKIDGISTYTTSTESGGTVNVLVAMSKG